jgi:hypothetical protein
MASRRLAVSVPEPLLDALYAEGSRTCQTPGQVAARVLREALPSYVERELRHDLAPVIRGRVIDVRPTPSPNAATPAGLPAGATSESAHDHADRRIAAPASELEPSCDARPTG